MTGWSTSFTPRGLVWACRLDPSWSQLVTDIDTPEPLTDWLKGTLTLGFSHGATVTRNASLSTAQVVRDIAAGKREGDWLRWPDTGWFQMATEQVVFTEFVLAEDGGWPLAAEERRTLADTSYPRGLLVALRDFWKTDMGPEVSYSARALLLMHQSLLTDPPIEFLGRMARDFEGDTGAARARLFCETVAGPREDADAENEASPDGPGTTPPTSEAGDHVPESDDVTKAEADAAVDPAEEALSNEPTDDGEPV